VQVFPNRVFESIPTRDMHEGVTAALDRLDPDGVAIISYSFPDARACLSWCRRRRRTAVLMSSTKEDDGARVRWRERLKKVIVSQYDAALVGGTPQRRYLEALGFPPAAIFQPCTVVDNAFFADGAAAIRTRPKTVPPLPGLHDDTPFFLASGRFLALKNFDGLLRAYHRYRQSHERPWRLILLGDGPERSSLEALAAALHLDGVLFAGFRQIEELPAYYAQAGAFVHPSFKDTWGLVVNEAMATGLPVLVSDQVGCATDLVRNGENGFTFHPADTGALARAMAEIATSPGTRARFGQRSVAIISGWSPFAFAEGLWDAFEAGAARSQRPFAIAPRALLGAIRTAARRPSAFHTIPD
jgi:glycosyltransferase involved in cell wall biosynthesis